MKPRTCPVCISRTPSYFAAKGLYHFFHCSVCDSYFIYPPPTEKELDRFYASTFCYDDGKKNETVIRIRAKKILKRLKQLAPAARSLCDVGSGFGYFLDEVKKSYNIVQGIEPSKKLSLFTESQFYIPVAPLTLSSYLKTRKKSQFDIVTSIHVVEHVPHIKQYLIDLLQLVKPGGLLYIETPNADSHLLQVERGDYTFLIAPEHVWLVSKKTFDHIIPQDGEYRAISTYSYPEHFMGIIKKVFKSKKKSNVSNIRIFETGHVNKKISKLTWVKKMVFYALFDRLLAPLLTPVLNLYHKGSILELYIRKKT